MSSLIPRLFIVEVINYL